MGGILMKDTGVAIGGCFGILVYFGFKYIENSSKEYYTKHPIIYYDMPEEINIANEDNVLIIDSVTVGDTYRVIHFSFKK